MRRDRDLFSVRRDEGYDLSPLSGAGWPLHASLFGGSSWQTMRRMQEDIDRLFSQFLGAQGGTGFGLTQSAQQWAPHIDVSETDSDFRIEADLPGVRKEDVDVQVVDRQLILRAELPQPEAQPAGQAAGGQTTARRQYHQRERRYGFFQRVLTLPQNVDEENIRCDFRNGVLTIHLPKIASLSGRGRRIAIGESGTSTGQTSQAAQRPSSLGAPGNGNREPALSGAKGGEKSGSKAQNTATTRKSQTSGR